MGEVSGDDTLPVHSTGSDEQHKPRKDPGAHPEACAHNWRDTMGPRSRASLCAKALSQVNVQFMKKIKEGFALQNFQCYHRSRLMY
jgi:hypothetical protein